MSLLEEVALKCEHYYVYHHTLFCGQKQRVGEHSTELVLEGDVPSAINPPTGCPFHTRCSQCMDICSKKKPKPREIEPGHFVACHLADKEA